jgi:hypothetical protein
MDENLLALLEQLSPEELQQLMGMGTLDERGGMAQQQQARADALRNYEAPAMLTPGGAIGAGMGDLFREVGGGVGAMRAQGQMGDLLNEKDAGRSLYVDVLRRKPKATVEKAVDLSSPMAGMQGY